MGIFNIKDEKWVIEINYAVMVKTFLLGAMLAEILFLVMAVGNVLKHHYVVSNQAASFWLVTAYFYNNN
ncbi:MAG: hypothetical protein ACRC8T_05220 [Acidaminococcaceae bacterium]